MITYLLTTLCIIPLIGFVSCLCIPRTQERALFTVAITVLFLEVVTVAATIFAWLAAGAQPVTNQLGTLYSGGNYTFHLAQYFDATSAVFLVMTALMLTLIAVFSKFYLHRDPGFKRFYVTIFLFLTGLSLIILAGNFELLFVGWELIGISSVLLIAFYRDRYLPARNALKVFSVYRIGDAFLLAALLYAHHVFDHNAQFGELAALAAQHSGEMMVLGLLLLVVALVKSAQFPFSYWLPRAMEGPTTSSAIFYGALSVHMGLFLLLRTYPLWQGTIWLHVVIGLSGLVTAIVATTIARVQSSTKTQIAYSSIAQIGVMFIELALGLYWLALIHFVCNAALRAYQLLISPSMVGYLVHDQFFYFTPPVHKIKNTPLGKLYGTLYVLGIKEWDMNTNVRDYVWGPLKAVGRSMTEFDVSMKQGYLAVLAACGFVALLVLPIASELMLGFSAFAITLSVLLYIRAYSTKSHARVAWNLVALGHAYSALFLMATTHGNWLYFALYAAGIVVAYMAGLWCLAHVRAGGERDTLEQYHGAIYRYPRVGNLFFVVCLLFMAFPISPSFLAQETLLGMIPADHVLLVVLYCLGYLMMGIAVLRLYMKVFFGAHEASYHEKAYRSS